MSTATRALIVTAALVLAACAAMQQQKAQPVRADEGQFKNLKVLPQNISHDELVATMRSFARSLGVNCGGCHVPMPGQANKLDFVSDAKPEKTVARTMIVMTRNINANYISKVAMSDEPDEKGTAVTCYTCHRGHAHPDNTLPPPPAEPRPGS